MAITDKRLVRVNNMVFHDLTDPDTEALAYTPMLVFGGPDDGSLIVTNQSENGFRTIGDILADNKYDLIFESTQYKFSPAEPQLEVDFNYDVTLP